MTDSLWLTPAALQRLRDELADLTSGRDLDDAQRARVAELSTLIKGAEASSKPDDGLVEVSVADTGSGIAPEVAAQLFQPFVTTKANGMGVGLSICRTIVEAHGGKILVEPGPAGGTTFRFTLRTVDRKELAHAQ